MSLSVKEHVAQLGERLKQARLNADLTQEDIAELTGLSRKVVMRAERGQAQLETLVAILLALNLDKHLDRFLPQSAPSPVQMAKLKNKQRQRASGKRVIKTDIPSTW